MAATYPPLLATGFTDQGRFDPFDLYGGESDIVTDQGEAPAGQAILQFQVLMRDADGKLIPFTSAGAGYATGTITVGGQPVATDTLTINGVVITFRTALTFVGVECLIGTSTTVTASNLAAVINANVATLNCTAAASGTTVTLVAEDVGTAGNSVTVVEGVAAAGFTVSGATLTGGSAAEGTPSNNAIGIAAQPLDAASTSRWFPYFTGGVFNHQALVWPAGFMSLEERKRAFDGSNIGVRQVL
jgi:hypothetical protein